MSKSKDKGTRIEREIADRLTKIGIPTRRVVGSGAFGGFDERLKGDLQIGTLANGTWLLTGEVKARRTGAGFKVIEGWLAENDCLFLRRNNTAPLVVLPMAVFESLAEAAYELEKAGGHVPKETLNKNGDKE